MRSFVLGSLLLATLTPALPALADSGTLLNLSANVQRELPNDEINASLYVQERQAQPAVLADHLNKALARARSESGAFKQVEFSSGNYNSWPDYSRDGKIQGWQGRAQIHLKSRDFTAAAELVARLQKFMLLENVQFGVADSTRRQVESSLIPEAISALQAQAAAAGKALGRNSQQVLELNIGNVQAPPPMPMLRAKAMMADTAAAEVATPDWQPGNSQVQLNVSGRIELR
ncbi:SIMPL domain-containing protein [Vogesella sp. LIG4]|uniref:SIMPL domain-containing protein n=1 Tax=Vogesella sp. LIG4 TaxID=1192162 RepID=UPI000820104C|nr:SIMPL domain-containing protein [Vogesella sp. LIG4]SCK18098.1 Predicted secreted protein [Vogesella sp. LIG4]